MAKLEDRLAAGLEAQDWQETASRGPWRRFGKFGRGAMYVHALAWGGWHCSTHHLWFSELHETTPKWPVVGPILDQILTAGDKQLAQERIDTEALLIELLYTGDTK